MKYTYPNEATLTKIGRELVTEMNTQNPIFDFVFPIVEKREIKVRWYQDDNVGGLMKIRGAGGPPTRRNPVGRTYFETEPGHFGEFMGIDEIELLALGRGIPKNNLAIAVDVSDRVDQHMQTLRQVYYNRLRQMAWTLARLGDLKIYLPTGGIGYEEAFTVRTRTAPILWTNLATAKPLFDLQQQHQLYGVGTAYAFGYTSVVIMNTYTSNLLFGNTNAADWGGKKGVGGESSQGMGTYDIVRVGMLLPRIIIWDGGYLAEDGTTWVFDCPNGEIIHVAVRPDGEKPGEMQLTYNAVNGETGTYAFVDDRRTGPTRQVPPGLDVHMGFSGGLAAHHILQWCRLIVA